MGAFLRSLLILLALVTNLSAEQSAIYTENLPEEAGTLTVRASSSELSLSEEVRAEIELQLSPSFRGEIGIEEEESFERLSIKKEDPILLADDKVVSRYNLRLEPKVTGVLPFPKIMVKFWREGEREPREVLIQSLSIKVRSIIEDEAPLDQIKPLMTVESKYRFQYLWLLLGGSALLLIGWWYYRRLTSSVLKDQYLTPEEWALTEISKLDSEPNGPREVRERCYALSLILRGWVERRYSIPVVEQTTEEFLRSISNSDRFKPELRKVIELVSRTLDLVKYGAEDSSVDQSRRVLEELQRVIGSYSKGGEG